MKLINNNNSDEEDIAREFIEKAIRQIREREDPDELNNFKRIIKKNVSIFLRSYLSAYLLKEFLRGNGKSKKDNFTTLFISVGKSRKVFPNDLIDLFMKKLQLKRSDIGEIKILDNYSFMDISLDQASEAITRISGTNFRGRRLTVNRARKKKRK